MGRGLTRARRPLAMAAVKAGTLLAAALLGLGTAGPLAAATPDLKRGRLLYENHCQGCHTSQVHIRARRKVRSLDDIRYFVVRWAAAQDLDWGFDEVESVALYVDAAFYGDVRVEPAGQPPRVPGR